MVSKSILITGCASGIGKYLANALQKDNWRVICTDRVADGNILPLDLADSNSIERTVKLVEELTEGKLYALINNAGIAYLGKLEDISRDDLRKQFEVNVFGVHELTNHLVKIFKKSGGGRIINISSVNGKISFPGMGAYSASKFALEAITDALRLELKGTNIKVSLIEPGTIESDFRSNTICRNFEPKEKKGQSPEIVYRQVKHALESRNPRIRYAAGDEYIVYLKYVLPDALFDRLMAYR